jgi:hypothetical protein
MTPGAPERSAHQRGNVLGATFIRSRARNHPESGEGLKQLVFDNPLTNGMQPADTHGLALSYFGTMGDCSRVCPVDEIASDVSNSHTLFPAPATAKGSSRAQAIR